MEPDAVRPERADKHGEDADAERINCTQTQSAAPQAVFSSYIRSPKALMPPNTCAASHVLGATPTVSQALCTSCLLPPEQGSQLE